MLDSYFSPAKRVRNQGAGEKSDARHRTENLGSMWHVTRSFQNIGMIVRKSARIARDSDGDVDVRKWQVRA
jgi:hypothetical protein